MGHWDHRSLVGEENVSANVCQAHLDLYPRDFVLSSVDGSTIQCALPSLHGPAAHEETCIRCSVSQKIIRCVVYPSSVSLALVFSLAAAHRNRRNFVTSP